MMLLTTILAECQVAKKAGVVAVKIKRPGDDKRNKDFQRIKDMSAVDFKPFPPPPSVVVPVVPDTAKTPELKTTPVPTETVKSPGLITKTKSEDKVNQKKKKAPSKPKSKDNAKTKNKSKSK